MNLKTPSLAAITAALAIAASPTVSHAAKASDAAMDACVRSFVESYLPQATVKKVRKLAPPANAAAYVTSPDSYTIDLSAHGARSGDLVARARCVTKKNGIVLVEELE